MTGLNVFIGLLLFASGTALAFYGHALFRAYVAMVGALIGFYAGLGLFFTLGGEGAFGAILAGTLLAVTCSLIAYHVYALSVFIAGSGLGAVVAAIGGLLATGELPDPVLIAALAGATGVLAVAVDRLLIVLGTAATGAALMVAAPMAALALSEGVYGAISRISETVVGLAIIWLIFAALGFAFQYRRARTIAPEDGPARRAGGQARSAWIALAVYGVAMTTWGVHLGRPAIVERQAKALCSSCIGLSLE